MQKSAGDKTKNQELSVLLRSMRRARGMSQGELARRAAVSDSTLSRWEAGKFAPNIPELESVLAALGATDTERSAVLLRLHTPRAVQRLREVAGAAAPPVRGDLLWAMRQRQGWTQAETARKVGVAQAQIARWEKGEAWPDAVNLHSLCWHLNAYPVEIAALAAGTRIPDTAPPPPDRGAWLLYLRSLMHENAPPDDLLDVSMIGVEARLSHLAADYDFAAELLPVAYTIHARHHYARDRNRQAEHYAVRSLALARRQSKKWLREVGGAYWIASVIICAFAARQRRVPMASRHAYRQMREGLDQIPPSDLHYTWALSETARCLQSTGNRDEAIAMGKAACMEAKKVGPVEEYFRMRQHARILLDAGMPDQSMNLLDTADVLVARHPFSSEQIGILRLMRGEALLALGLRHEAHDQICLAQRLLPVHEVTPWSKSLSQLTARL